MEARWDAWPGKTSSRRKLYQRNQLPAASWHSRPVLLRRKKLEVEESSENSKTSVMKEYTWRIQDGGTDHTEYLNSGSAVRVSND